MHYLHRILVNISELREEKGRKPNAKEIRDFAEARTENYYGIAYDWRETDSAGRWKVLYPKQVYLASNNLEWFKNELNEVIAIQRNNLESAVEQLRSSCGTDLDKIIDSLWQFKNAWDRREDGTNGMTAYYLAKIAQLLHGDYDADSCFYNTDTYLANLIKAKEVQYAR